MICRRGKKLDPVMDMPDDKFLPWNTMFKLDRPDGGTVECVACRAQFPLADLLAGELEEDSCPTCKSHTSTYWTRFRLRAVPTIVNDS